MKIIETKIEIQAYLKSNSNSKIGFVPTMGALHQGHLELVKRSKKENDLSVCSIFVNPTQFNNSEDLLKYPRTLEEDCKKLEEIGCDVVFAPTFDEMYASMPTLKFDFGHLEHIMEGKFRPGHFNGVGIVVSKLFNILKPTHAYFGQKDIQQVAIIKSLVKDLNFDLKIIVCDTIREKNGLAMSSRNIRLSEHAKEIAPKIYESLLLAKKLLLMGVNAENTKIEINNFYKNFLPFELEYFEITDYNSLQNIAFHNPEGQTAVIIATYLDGVRLIDNLVF